MSKKSNLIIFMPSVEGGGVEKNLFLISNFLSLKIQKITFITASSKIKKLNKKIHIYNPKFLNKITNSRFIKIALSSFLLIKALKKNKNTVVLSFQANLFAILISYFFKNKVIVRLNSSPSGWIKSNLKKKIFKKIYSLSNLIIVNSKEFEKELSNKFKLKSFCIYNPLDKKNIIKKSSDKLRFNPFKKKNSLKVINVGRLVDQKDQLTLLKSINQIKNIVKVELLIIGQGKNEYLLRDYIEKNNLKNFVKILPFKNNPYPYIKCSDVFVLSSKYEGLPNVLLEAMVLKKFIISSSCPTGPKEILNYGRNGLLFKPGSHKELSKKLILFNKKKTQYNQKIKYSFKTLKKYDYTKNLKLYLKKIEELRINN